MTTHLLMTITVLILFGLSHKIYIYKHLLQHLLSTSMHPMLQPKIDYPVMHETHNAVILELQQCSSLQQLSIFSIIITCLLWGLGTFYGPIESVWIWGSILVVSASITLTFKKDILPVWVEDWAEVISKATREVELEAIREQLSLVSAELKEVENGKEIGETDLAELKLKGLVLSYEALRITGNHEEAQKIQNMLQ